ncbi:MAG: hypothetical protein ACFFDW_16530 [Candidatus Thorarchaeota archaeon]
MESTTTSTSTKTIQRFASLDFQRGLAIILMTLLHGFSDFYDSSWLQNDYSQILAWPIPVIIIFVGISFLAIWNAYFLLISTIVNSISMSRKMRNGINPNNVLLKQMINGFGIIFAGFIKDVIGYGGYIGTAIQTGDWTDTFPLWEGFFAMHTLQIIGWSIIITSIINYFILRKEGYRHYIRNMIIYGILTILVICLSPLFAYLIDKIPWQIPPEMPELSWPDNYLQAYNASFKAWICTLIAGNMEPLFPYLATAFIGSMIGITLTEPNPIKKFPLIGGLTSLGLTIIGAIIFALSGFSFVTGRPTIGLYLVLLGAQLGSLFLLLWLIEYRGNATKFGNNRIIKHIRLWGMLSLTLYVLDIFELLPRWIATLFHRLIFHSTADFVRHPLNYGQEYWALLMALVILVAYGLLVWLWSKLNFVFSLEWFLIRLNSLGTKQKSKRLEVKLMMNEVHWISLKSQQNSSANQ